MRFDLNKPLRPAYGGGEEIPQLQILKLICAFFVIQIHTTSCIRDAILPLCRIAVPVFFMISGYFLTDRNGQLTAGRIIRSLRKIAVITLTANAVYLTIRLAGTLATGGTFLQLMLRPVWWAKLILIGEQLCGALWYLTAYIEVLLILYAALRLKALNALYPLAALGLVAALACGKYIGLFAPADTVGSVYMVRNALTMGLPCVLAGILLRRNQHLLPPLRVILALTALTAMLLAAENFVLLPGLFATQSRGDITLLTLPLAVLVLAACLQMPHDRRLDPLAGLGRRHSLNLYLYHILILQFLMRIPLDLTAVQTFVVAALTLAFSAALEHGKSRLRSASAAVG